MNSQTSDNISSTSGSSSMDDLSDGSSMADSTGAVRRVAQKAHETVDKLEQTVSSGSERMMSMQEEYGAYAREQIKAKPLTIVASAFAFGLLLGKMLR